MPAVRNPFEPDFAGALLKVLARPRLWKRYSAVRMLQQFAREFRRQVAAQADKLATDLGVWNSSFSTNIWTGCP